uniref:Glucosamine 6-phosphate N-acetyltransferase n=1 Tax=Lygus hesperus TaxID=30085 RepID=A0A0A9XFX8_LYGHE
MEQQEGDGVRDDNEILAVRVPEVVERFYNDWELKTKAVLMFRRAQVSDYDRGFPALLGQLTTLGNISREAYEQRLNTLVNINKTGPCTYWLLVAEDVESNRIIACGTLMVELKFIHECGKVGHIEDVVVDQEYRKLRIGQKMIKILLDIAEGEGCYKVMLDCNDTNVPFYQSVGFELNSRHMAKYSH